MNEEQRGWRILEDTDFIGSTIPEDSLVGFYEFTDGVLLVCSDTGESSGGSDSEESPGESEEDTFSWEDFDDIPF